MDDLPHHTLNVVVALSRVKHTVLGCTLAVGVVGLEHRSPTLTLGPDNATHLQDKDKNRAVKWGPEQTKSRQQPSDSSKLLQALPTGHGLAATSPSKDLRSV
jgi:hypothetical protein